jgi:hypothetical protein
MQTRYGWTPNVWTTLPGGAVIDGGALRMISLASRAALAAYVAGGETSMATRLCLYYASSGEMSALRR